jgi:4-amino-4-deoxy-L-arabinose transferase-like glycosyltransferase
MRSLGRGVPPLAWVAAPAGAGLLLFWIGTGAGVGLPPDSTTYVDAARSLRDGLGYALSTPEGGARPITHFPPLYSAVLAGLALLGPDPLDLVRPLHAAILAGSVALVVWLLARAAPGSLWLPLLGAAAMALSPVQLELHAQAVSEPLGLILTISGLGLLAAHLAQPRRGALMGAAALAGLAFLTRYAGVALLGTGALLLLAREGPARRRAAEATLFLSLASLPMAAWMLHNALATGAPTDRSFAFHPVGARALLTMLETFAGWFAPGAPVASIGLPLLVLVIGVIDCVRRRVVPRPPCDPLPRVLLCYAGVYLAFLIVSISFFDAATPLNDRILSPVFVVAWIVALLGARHWIAVRERRGLAWLLAALAAVPLAGYANEARDWARLHARHGGGNYGSRDWRASPTIDFVRGLPESVSIYTNAPDAVRLLAGRASRMVPRRIDSGTRQPVSDYPLRIAELRDAVRVGAPIVWFDRVRWRWYLTPLKTLREVLPIRRTQKFTDGSVFVYDPSRERPE